MVQKLGLHTDLGTMDMEVEEGTSNGEGAEYAEEVRCFKSEPVNNGFGFDSINDFGDGSSGASENFRTYKRRKQLRSSSKIKVQGDCRASIDKVQRQITEALQTPWPEVPWFRVQAYALCVSFAYDAGISFVRDLVKEIFIVPLAGTDHCASINGSNERLHRQWKNVVLEHMHQLLSGDEGGIQCCIRDALLFHSENGCNLTIKEPDTSHGGRQNCSLQAGRMPNGTKYTAEGLKGVTSNGSLKENSQTTTEMCQRVFFDVITSEKFTSLCKLLFDNFQGIKVDSLFNLGLINSRMKNGIYEHSPMLFSSDIQRVWRKLQEIGTEIVSLAKSLSNISNTSYSKQVGCSRGAFEDDKYRFCTRASESLAKPEQAEACGVYKVCTCWCCGKQADGKDCLVCDSCEDIYHVACIEPAVKEIPPKSWYCANCTANGIGSPHENCVICERLNDPRTLNNDVADENHNTDCETFTELEENSNCSVDNQLQSIPGSKTPCVCKICGSDIEKGEKMRNCEHPYCPNKYYHVRCLTRKQLRSHCSRWYCPSCLCRKCLTDRDDDKIVLCDGCDAAYHIDCMKPPRTSIPRGKWFCRKCDDGIQRIRKAKRAYQYLENKLKMKGIGGKMPYDNGEMNLNEKEREDSDKSRGGVDMLLTAANTLSNEEKLAAI
ncbi:Zinc finger, FYVE/PHD-type [Corchorus capsularis]|uniref:Zinc finger, FYVE/PHD-type n=1 Tax=Corchorus capsularis TaxID=210143 RepID=A0A1R3GH58_COCAP|nr:Zinc finger, FYVE/PHD-type [Corchorus capsularis]